MKGCKQDSDFRVTFQRKVFPTDDRSAHKKKVDDRKHVFKNIRNDPN